MKFNQPYWVKKGARARGLTTSQKMEEKCDKALNPAAAGPRHARHSHRSGWSRSKRRDARPGPAHTSSRGRSSLHGNGALDEADDEQTDAPELNRWRCDAEEAGAISTQIVNEPGCCWCARTQRSPRARTRVVSGQIGRIPPAAQMGTPAWLAARSAEPGAPQTSRSKLTFCVSKESKSVFEKKIMPLSVQPRRLLLLVHWETPFH